jgi:chemotaxis receptor (MCP) glutamine deamidase CheD
LAAAAAVALIVSVPVLLAPTVNEITWARYTCAAIIGVVGYMVARGAERSRIRSILFGIAVLVAAFAVAALKHALAGH